MNKVLDIVVSHIGIGKINISGSDAKYIVSGQKYETDNRVIKINDETRVIRNEIVFFENENEMINFLQVLIDNGARFTDNYKSNAYMEACLYQASGKLVGDIIS